MKPVSDPVLPPRTLRRFLAWLLPPDGGVRDGLLGDLDELYAEHIARGRGAAGRWYARQVLTAAVHYPARRLAMWVLRGEGSGVMKGFAKDLAYATRTLRASPGFAIATVVTLGLGIGASLMVHGYGRLARPGPRGLEDPGRLVALGEGQPGCPRCLSLSSGDFGALRDRARSFEQMSLFEEWEPTLRGTDTGELLDGLRVTPEIFNTLGTRPLLGRLFVTDDGTPGNDRVVVIGEHAWRSRLGGDSTVIGRTVILDRMPFTVVGVVSGGLVFPDAGDPAEVWAPMAWSPETASDRTNRGYQVVARLREGATVQAASAELAILSRPAAGEAPGITGDPTYRATPLLEEDMFGSVPPMLVAAVGLVLLITWTNLAGLLVARLSARRGELTVRLALGAAPMRIVRQLLAEATLLAGLGSLCAVGVAFAGARILLGATQPLDLRAMGLVLSLGLISGMAVSAWPAFRFARPRGASRLSNTSRTATGGVETDRARGALIVAEVALATVLLSATALLARSFQNVHQIEPGFNADRVLALRVWDPPPDPGAEPPSERVDRLIETLQALPGVVRAGGVLGLPFGLGAPTRDFELEGHPVLEPVARHRARMQAATPDYFASLEVPLLRGRSFSHADGADAPRVVILNQAAATRFFPDQDPIGRGVLMDGVRWEIVGVVGTVFDGDQEQLSTPEIYRPMRQWPRSSVWIAMRTRGVPAALGPEVRAAVREFDPDIAITNMLTMDALRASSMSAEGGLLRVMTGFALAAILMSAVGLYGLVSYSVSQRTREFGVRKALGAPTAAVLRLVLAQGLRLTAGGAAIGIAGAVLTLRAMRSLLFGVSPADPLTLGAVVAAVCGVSLLATYMPAKRATRVDAITSLSSE